MDKSITIAIDGHSGCGKSTLAKALAKALNYLYIDSGAMYRAVTWYLLSNHVDIKDEEAIVLALDELEIGFTEVDGASHVTANGADVEPFIRGLSISNHVSQVAEFKAVRDKLVAQQKALGANKRIVMDGRDIGTAVFPDAELKIFLTADTETRVGRRVRDIMGKGKYVSIVNVRKNLVERDRIDSTRDISPLKQAEDAIVIDNTDLDKDEQLAVAIKLAKEKAEEATPKN